MPEPELVPISDVV